MIIIHIYVFELISKITKKISVNEGDVQSLNEPRGFRASL